MAITNTPQTIKHNNRSQNRDFNIFVEEYFGGSDAFIYINGKRMHDIAAISFQISEQHKPIYGYGSRTYDDLAVGSRIVSGAIRIPVRNTESSDFSNSWGTVSVNRNVTERLSVPDWVYNYQPQKESDVVVKKEDDKDVLSVVAQVQERLSLEPSGIIDESTRNTINQYRIDNKMLLGTLIDNELLSSLGIEDYKCYAASDTVLYDSPMMTREICSIKRDDLLIYIASDEETILARTEEGLAGYVRIGDVYRL